MVVSSNGLKFLCNRCPKSYNSFKELVEHFESVHRHEGETQVVERTSYRDDKGCQEATEFLGYQSLCLQCPFGDCVLDIKDEGAKTRKKKVRNEQILQAIKDGSRVEEVAVFYGISTRTVQRVLKEESSE
ncbi:hypothetical protein LCGC14_1729060 [marine sediment metagenome]|uniref:C2H2-type domain-containing protein n=1 Tax=marine sediment metagenome TaxID=412755 RepID=A0A0F9K9U6_9ZZZZ